MEVTVDEMMADYYAHQFFEDPKEAEKDEDDDFDQDSVADELAMLSRSKPPPVVDDWEDVN